MQTVEEKDWVQGFYVAVAVIDRSMADICSQFHFTAEDYEQDGLGLARGKGVKLDDGRQFVFEQLLQAPPPWDQQTTIYCAADDWNMDRDLTDILKEMQAGKQELTWLHPDIDAARLLQALTPPAPKGPAAPAP